jgi:glycosyltransferase involved in cell wall biosynthesis
MISFVVPAYNEESCIADCISSIGDDVFDGFVTVPHEIIVVDNNSTDHTAQIARAYGATVIKELRKGTSWARQAGLEASKYDIVAFIDADCQIFKGWSDFAYQTLMQPNVVAVSGPHLFYELGLSKRILIFIFYCFAKVLHTMWPTTNGANLIVRKQALIDAGGFDTTIPFHGDDTAVAVRLSTQGKIEFDLGLFVLSSARRFKAEGLFKTGWLYILNYFWVWLTGHPFTRTYNDVRL